MFVEILLNKSTTTWKSFLNQESRMISDRLMYTVCVKAKAVIWCISEDISDCWVSVYMYKSYYHGNDWVIDKNTLEI